MEEPSKETVIIVHGTWAAPDPAKRRWYQPVEGAPAAEGFVSKLDAALQKRGSPARCWAHCSKGNPIFQWSGENSWIARTRAASAIGDYVAKLRTEGWLCHIVAHSHGGNVVVEALPKIMAATGPDTPDGKLVTLGTPFMDTMSPVLKSAERRRRVLSKAFWIGFVVVALWVIITASRYYDFIHDYGLSFTVDFWLSIVQRGSPTAILMDLIPLLVFVLLLIGVFLSRRRRRGTDRGSPLVIFSEAEQVHPQLLVLGSPMDEAWQVLHHVRTIDNPLEVKSNLFVYLFSSLRSAALRSAMIARIYGAKSYGDLSKAGKWMAAFVYLLSFFAVIYAGWSAKDARVPFAVTIWWLVEVLLWFLAIIALTRFFGESFFSACLSPLRWCAQKLGSLATVFTAMVTYGVRYYSWPVLLNIVAGLEGYRFDAPPIERCPSNIPEKFVKYENMPTDAEKRSLEKRSTWIARHLGDVSETFSKLAVTAADITALLQTIEEDQTLVHAAYYTDDECIARIADWVASKASASEGEADQPLLTQSRITA